MLLVWMEVQRKFSTRKERENVFNYFHSSFLKIKKKKEGIFGFEIHGEIKDYNAHRFFKVHIINNTRKHIIN